MTPITLPVQGDQELDIVVLEHDPETPCNADSRVATHSMLTPACPPHPICTEHAEEISAGLRNWERQMGSRTALFNCALHRTTWQSTVSSIRVVPGAPGGGA